MPAAHTGPFASVIVQNGGSIAFDPTTSGTSGTALFVGGNGNGSLTITGTGSNVTVSHDVVIGRNATPFGVTGTLSLVSGGTLTLASTAKVYLGGSLNGETLHNGTGIINFGSGGASGTLAFTGNMLLEGNSQINFNNTGTTTLAANILNDFSGATLALSKVGSGTAILSGNNNYTGTTTVGGGTLQAGSLSGFSANSDFTVSGGTLDLNGFSNSIGSLAGTGTVTNSGAAAATLSAGGDNASTTFSGVIQNGTGALALNKQGTGTLILSGTSTYSGLTDVQGGQLSVRGTLTNSAVQVESGATLGGTGAISGAVTVTQRRDIVPGKQRRRHSDGRFAGVELRVGIQL